MSKPRVGVFSFTSCEGCQLTILSLEEELLDLLRRIDIVNFREAIDDRQRGFDIALVEGSITTPEEVDEVQEIREQAGLLVAIGSCACLGGVNAIKERHDLSRVRHLVYGDGAHHFPTLPTRRVRDVVKVDYELHGCPIAKRELLDALKTLLIGQMPRVEDRAVCTECKVRANACLYERGICCLGPIVRAGCDAICPAFGEGCSGCRGILGDANVASMVEILKSKGMSRLEVEDALTRYNALTPVDLKPYFGG